MKIKKFIYDHRISLFTILTIYLYNYIFVTELEPFKVDEITYAYHTVDYSMGFCTKILPGALYNKLVGIYNYETVSLFVNILFCLFVCLLAVAIEKKASMCFQKLSWYHIFAFLLFATGPFTFATFVDEFGLLDFYWVFMGLISILILQNQYFKYLLPVMVFLIILVNYSSVIACVAVLLLMVLFLCVNAKDKKTRSCYIGLFATSLLTAVAETVYFLKCEYSNLKYSMDEFNYIIENERNAKYTLYYDFSFYRILPSKYGDMPMLWSKFDAEETKGFSGLLKNIYYQIKVTIAYNDPAYDWFIFILAIGLFLLLTYVVISYIKKTDNIQKKVVSGLIIPLSLGIVVLGIAFSTDISRWLSHAFLCFFAFDLFIIFTDYNDFFEKTSAKFRNLLWMLLGYYILYAFTTVDVYQ